jgi:hypothetical protein
MVPPVARITTRGLAGAWAEASAAQALSTSAVAQRTN